MWVQYMRFSQFFLVLFALSSHLVLPLVAGLWTNRVLKLTKYIQVFRCSFFCKKRAARSGYSQPILIHFFRYLIPKCSFLFLVKNERPGVDIRNRPRIPIPDEDPYSVAGNWKYHW